MMMVENINDGSGCPHDNLTIRVSAVAEKTWQWNEKDHAWKELTSNITDEEWKTAYIVCNDCGDDDISINDARQRK